jgi:ribosome maturation factor RimP
VGIDQCEEVSRHLSLLLDVEDIIPGAYTLEVSSPGLERIFFSPEQMCAYEGKTVRVRLHTAKEGRKNFQGRLTSVKPPLFTLHDGNAVFEFNWEDVNKANLVYEHHVPVKPGKR